MANVKISTINTTAGYQQPVNPNADGVVANGFYPQNATSNDADAGIERAASGALEIHAGGAPRVAVTANGNVSIDAPDTDSSSLSVTGFGGTNPAIFTDGGVEAGGSISGYGIYPQNGVPATDVSVTKDGSGNLVLTDGNVGALTLTQLSTATVNVYTTSDTYTKPAGATMARVLLMGGGGGGQAGQSGNAGTGRNGGAGGGAGQFLDMTISLAAITSGVTVTVGAKGTGGSTSGGNGSVGGDTTFGTVGSGADAWGLIAKGGNGGTNGTGGTSYSPYMAGSTPLISSGGNSSVTIASPGIASFSGGGGAGGGVNASNTTYSGAAGALAPALGLQYASRGQTAAASTAGTAGGGGGTGNTTQVGFGINNANIFFGSGGGGGASSASTAGGNGGAAAANSGAGGGGGGAGTGGFGSGGDGGTGWVVIISW